MNFLSLTLSIQNGKKTTVSVFAAAKVLFATLSLLITHLVSNSPVCNKYAQTSYAKCLGPKNGYYLCCKVAKYLRKPDLLCLERCTTLKGFQS